MNDRNENRPGYKETKVGWIPEDWNAHACADITKQDAPICYGVVQVGTHTEDGVPIIAIKYLDGIATAPLHRSEKAIESQYKRSRVKPQDVLISVKGTIGEVGVVPDGFEGNISREIARLRVNSSNSPYFLAQQLQAADTQQRISKAVVGTTRLEFSIATLRKFLLSLPPIPEQEAIAEVLSCWDKGLENLEKLIDAKKLRKKGLMQKLLTGEKRLPAFQRTEAGDQKSEWKEVRLGDVFKEVKRPVDWDDNNTYSLISVRRRSGGAFLRDQLKGSQILTKNMFTTHTGDFLISKMQVLHGAMAQVPRHLDGMHISGSYIALRKKSDDSIDMNFFERLSQMKDFYHLTYLSSYGVHIEKMTFNFKWFMKSEISIPPTLEEQKAIAAVLETADEEIRLLEAERDALADQKKGLMQKLLTGEVRCPEYRAAC